MVVSPAARRVTVSGPAAALAVLLLAAASCHNVTEYGDAGTAGLHVIGCSDLAVRGTMSGFEGARSLLSYGDDLLVAANTGMLYWVDTGALEVDRSVLIGQPFPSGYSDMTVSREGTVYVIGGFNSVIEVSPYSGVVLDEFYAGPAPLAVAAEPGDSFLYVCDAADGTMREVLTVTNGIIREVTLPSTVCAFEPFDPGSGIIPYRASFVAVSADSASVYVIMADELTVVVEEVLAGFPGPSADVAAMPDTTIFVAVHPYVTGAFPGVSHVRYAPPQYGSELTGIAVEGSARAVCCHAGDFFVASWLGDGTTRVTRIDGLSGTVTGSVDVPGYPWDVEALGGDDVVVLTSE